MTEHAQQRAEDLHTRMPTGRGNVAEQPMRILIADDNDDLRSATQTMLEAHGHTVAAAQDGAEALREFGQLIGTAGIDLLVTDIDMPHVDGLALLEDCRRRLPSLPVVLTTADPGTAVLERLAAGDVAFVAKPYASESLTQAIDEAVVRAREPRPDSSWSQRTSPASAAGPSLAVEGVRPAPQDKSRGVRLALAAVVVAVLGAGALYRTPAPPPLPAPIEGDIARSVRVAPVAPIGALDRRPTQLEWEPTAGAVSYAVELRRIDRDVVWETRLDAPPALLPPEVIAALDPEVIFTWRIEALGPGDRRLAWSEAVRFQIRGNETEGDGHNVEREQGRGGNGS